MMPTVKSATLFVAAVAAICSFGCSRSSEPRDDAPSTNLPPGERIYRSYCSGCHGDQGRGDGPAAARFKPVPTDLVNGPFKKGSTPEAIRKAIVEGVPPAMVPVKTLKNDELDALVDHVHRMSRGS